MSSETVRGNEVQHKEEGLRSEGFAPYVDSYFVQRLKGISYLGVLDYVYKLDPISNRYDHSICVAHLALELSKQLELQEEMRRAFVIANILHDVGHAAFSHNSEPFLRENLSYYHQGLRSAIFMQKNRFATNGVSLAQILSSEKSSVARCVRDLILESREAEQPVQTLFRNPLNCDKIEGNYRTMVHLGRRNVKPSDMLRIFSIWHGNVYVNRDSLRLVIDFWEAERELYWKDIYTTSVFAAEAMITRALEDCFRGAEEIQKFLFCTDEDVFKYAEGSGLAHRLLTRVRHNDLFLSLAEERPELLSAYEEQLRNSDRDKARRARIEGELARALNTEPSNVISHFSRRKYFDSQTDELYQMNLFDADPGRIPLERVIAALTNSKRAADFFDVFYSGS